MISGPVLWDCDTGPGRLAKLSIDDPRWDEWAKKMHDKGVIIIGLLPNLTSVTALLDELFDCFKQATRIKTQNIYTRKVKENSKAVKKLKEDIAQRKAAGEDISPDDICKINGTVTLSKVDVSEIFLVPLMMMALQILSCPGKRVSLRRKLIAPWRR